MSAQRERGRLGRLIGSVIYVDSTRNDGQVVDEEQILGKYNGRIIGSVTIEQFDVFERGRSWLQKTANRAHIITRENVIRRDLLFSVGDVFDAWEVVQSNRILQGRDYISRAWVSVGERDDGSLEVRVTTVDSWTIGVSGGKYTGKRVMGEVYDHNFLGKGVKLGAKSYFSYDKGLHYGSEMIDAQTPNLAGTLFGARVMVGKDIESRHLEAELGKEFIRRNDYIAGAAYRDVDDRFYDVYTPLRQERIRLWEKRVDVWGGRARQLRGDVNGYVAAHYSHQGFPARPAETAHGVNPLLHGRDELLVSTGLYRERFYSSTMVYGYGFQEYIATGFRMGVVGGRSWQEFGDYWYGGARIRGGGFWRGGFMLGDVSAGGYFGGDGARRRVVDASVFWFSNLWGKGNNRARQFVTLMYTQGWRMEQGVGSMVGFSTKAVRPAVFRDYGVGRTRLLLKTQTVVFTRHKPLGFRLAVFSFADGGFVGMSDNPFRNQFFSTFGLGVRFKNERLIFNALQLRLGFAVGREGFVRSQIFSAATEQRIEQHRLIPSRPERVMFQ